MQSPREPIFSELQQLAFCHLKFEYVRTHRYACRQVCAILRRVDTNRVVSECDVD